MTDVVDSGRSAAHRRRPRSKSRIQPSKLSGRPVSEGGSRYAEVILSVRGCTKEPYRVVIGVIRDASEEAFRVEVGKRLLNSQV
jgi:hypothetical protein